MFATPLQATACNPLKSSESKKLRRQIQNKFPTISEDQLAEIWPALSQVVLQKSKKYSIYSIEDRPVFLEVFQDGQMQLYPTLYTLQIAPQIMETVTIHPGLVGKLNEGAPLFLPGLVVKDVEPGKSWVKENFGTFDKGEVRVLVEDGGWAPVALASWSMSSSELEFQGLKGKGMDLLHCRGDHLWKEGHGRVPKEAPNSAVVAVDLFQRKIALAKEQEEMKRQQHAEEIRRQEQAKFVEDAPRLIKNKKKALRQISDLKEKVKSGTITPNPDQVQKLEREPILAQEIADIEMRLNLILNPTPSTEVPDTWEEVLEDEKEEPVTAQETETNTDQNDNIESSEDVSDTLPEAQEADEDKVSMDDLLKQCFCYALQQIQDTELPILISTFYAQHMIPKSSELKGGSDGIQIKQTKFKKIGNFLDEMSREDFIKMVTEKAGVQRITKVNRSHPDLVEFNVTHYLAQRDVEPDSEVTGLNKENRWTGQLPKKGTKFVNVSQKKVKGNKNITVVSNMENFGIRLDDTLKKELAKKFSVAVSFTDVPGEGMSIIVQGKYYQQLQQWVTERFQIPKKYVNVNAKKK
eukprot:m.143613 g.143613  ORF g.143613 m.143613 type:complete len:579 (-) comp14903_c0_seq2:92-1828(-)